MVMVLALGIVDTGGMADSTVIHGDTDGREDGLVIGFPLSHGAVGVGGRQYYYGICGILGYSRHGQPCLFSWSLRYPLKCFTSFVSIAQGAFLIQGGTYIANTEIQGLGCGKA